MSATTTIDRREPVTEPTGTAAALPSPVASWVARQATWKAWVVSAIVYAVCAAAFFASTAPFAIPRVEALCGEPPLDMRIASSAGEVHGFLTSCGATGREAYRALQLADLVYPLVFAVFLATSLALVLSRLAPSRPRLLIVAALPFLASAFDYLENAFAWRALAAFPEATSTDGLLGWASLAKTATSWLAGGILMAALAALLVASARRWWAWGRHHLDVRSRNGLEQ